MSDWREPAQRSVGSMAVVEVQPPLEQLGVPFVGTKLTESAGRYPG
jgi:hypothetical protein